ncbi:hypothetical protein VTN00DRAFT_5332 [Thermoascus crustaceus]|uniref:uncharacterized protein n=1 Tax=Thermoascus crustaceus TaxID=5088 RepID=UPI00374434CF
MSQPTNQITTIIITTTTTNNNNSEVNTRRILPCGHAIPDSAESPIQCQPCDNFRFQVKHCSISELYSRRIKEYKDKADKLLKQRRPSNLSESERMEMREEAKKNEDMDYDLGEKKRRALG